MEYEIITRSDAIRQGRKRYFTGEACPQGHLTEKTTGSGTCVECHRLACQTWRQANKEKAQQANQNWHKANLERSRQAAKDWQRANPGQVNARGAARRALKLQATPSWADLDAIKAIYAACPLGYEVDHIVPLVSDTVCGLHIAANLQYLTSEDNSSKGNRWWPDMFKG